MSFPLPHSNAISSTSTISAILAMSSISSTRKLCISWICCRTKTSSGWPAEIQHLWAKSWQNKLHTGLPGEIQKQVEMPMRSKVQLNKGSRQCSASSGMETVTDRPHFTGTPQYTHVAINDAEQLLFDGLSSVSTPLAMCWLDRSRSVLCSGQTRKRFNFAPLCEARTDQERFALYKTCS